MSLHLLPIRMFDRQHLCRTLVPPEQASTERCERKVLRGQQSRLDWLGR